MKVTTATWHRKSNTFTLSDSSVNHTPASAMALLKRRGYSVDAAAKLLTSAKYAA